MAEVVPRNAQVHQPCGKSGADCSRRPICFGFADRDMQDGKFYVAVHRKEKVGPDEFMSENAVATLYLDPESQTAYLHNEPVSAAPSPSTS